MSSSKTYVPSTYELNKFITTVLKKNRDLDWQQLEKMIDKYRKDWDVPKARLQKFVKRQKAELKDDGSTSKSISSFLNNKGTTSSSVTSKVNGSVKSTPSTKKAPESAVKKAAAVSVPARSSADKTTAISRKGGVKKVVMPPTIVSMRKTNKEAVVQSLSWCYKDDNDGKKDTVCFCIPK